MNVSVAPRSSRLARFVSGLGCYESALPPGRDRVLLWGPSATSAAWIVAQTHYTYPFRSLSGQRAQIGDLERRGYRVAVRGGGYLVLHRPPAAQVASRAQPRSRAGRNPGREPGATRLRHTRVH